LVKYFFCNIFEAHPFFQWKTFQAMKYTTYRIVYLVKVWLKNLFLLFFKQNAVVEILDLHLSNEQISIKTHLVHSLVTQQIDSISPKHIRR